MWLFSKYKSSALTLFVILLCVLFFTMCINNQKDKPQQTSLNNSYQKFAGSAKCISCHKDVYEKHIHTAHFLTSSFATDQNITGSFDSGRNTFVYANGSMMVMEKKMDSFYQVGYINNIEKKRQRIDVTIGSGTKGQSYASWQSNTLVQLPITYFTSAGQWANSPGYPNRIAFNRPITSRCLECHATFAQKISLEKKEPEEFDKNSIVLGVDCEKCHGPAAEHVEFQTKNPADTLGKFILNPASFSRSQSLDLCALCHGGRMQKSKPSFKFTSGNKLADYFILDTARKDTASIDVHGNQYALMAASKCFTKTNTLTCISCHNTHENEKGKTATFSQKCLTCHTSTENKQVVCKLTALHEKKLDKHCTSCHMPEKPSLAIAVMLQGSIEPTRAMMHTHRIKIYPEESEKILDFIKKNK